MYDFRPNLPKSFWGESTYTTSYIIGRCPSSALDFKTSMELWSGKPADYTSLVFAHVKDGKLDARAVRCIFIGYPD